MRPFLMTGAAAALIGFAGYGATQTVQSISAKDKAEGAKAHPQLLEEFSLLSGHGFGWTSEHGTESILRLA